MSANYEPKHRHTWTSKPSYPEAGVFCMECGRKQTHHHKPGGELVTKYRFCVAPGRCSLLAHGGALQVARCSCGREQMTNVNGRYWERSDWLPVTHPSLYDEMEKGDGAR